MQALSLLNRSLTTASFLFLLSTGTALADKAPQRPSMEGMPPKPPAEAIAACDEKIVSDVCEFKGRRNELIQGVCTASPDKQHSSTIIACRPDVNDFPPPSEEGERSGGYPRSDDEQ